MQTMFANETMQSQYLKSQASADNITAYECETQNEKQNGCIYIYIYITNNKKQGQFQYTLISLN